MYNDGNVGVHVARLDQILRVLRHGGEVATAAGAGTKPLALEPPRLRIERARGYTGCLPQSRRTSTPGRERATWKSIRIGDLAVQTIPYSKFGLDSEEQREFALLCERYKRPAASLPHADEKCRGRQSTRRSARGPCRPALHRQPQVSCWHASNTVPSFLASNPALPTNWSLHN
jgi:hypothetical protein